MPALVELSPPPEPQLVSNLEATRLESRTDEQLDELPFGVIALSPEGVVLRYNLAESRLARLDRTTVYGRDFFREVAPCTATEEFQGRFTKLVASGEPGPVRFSYVFDFTFGAQEVEVELLRAGDARYYLLINRRRFFEPRAPGVRRAPAPRQSDLAPREEELGVVRDASAARLLTVSAPFWAAMRATWDRVAPSGYALFGYEWGFRWGRTAVIDLETQAMAAHGKGLMELPMRAALELLAAHLFDAGWGRLEVDFGSAADGIFFAELERNAWAEAVGRAQAPRCHVLSGFFRAVFCHLAQKLVTVRELSCACQGKTCTFAVVSQGKKSALDEAIERGKTDRDQTLAAFRELSRAPRS
ncbi:MAG: PAS domain-containing protein [Myxococcaceae bacterium]|nr:PAS domain-containing protein [Myxococcaceae bacterium]